MNTNLEYYKFFYYVGKLHSITLAAEELNVSQPAVSQAIRNLERELGTTLFMRTSRGVRLTAEGQTLYGYVQRGYETIREGERKFLEMQELTSGEVCIGASDMTLQFYLLSYLEQFHEQYPKIRITVTNAPTPETLKYLQSGRIDFGVVSTPMETTKNMHVIPVREIEDVFVAGRKFEYLKGGKLRIGTSAGYVPGGKYLYQKICRGISAGRRRCDSSGDRTCHQRYADTVCKKEPWHSKCGQGLCPGRN